ncbi:YggS family pyridoxal phosphate-dependent enzyme [Candidatus Sumerlaeota bacterium]|nr:YggS family pyridoxal phosphate-dependent enzyme [Candidatus Sumerlaeota bacterium]
MADDTGKLAIVKDNARRIIAELPPGVILEAASKTRSSEEVIAVIEAGVTRIGHNYVQEAESMINAIGQKAKWHFIGHLQKNKVKKAARLFDMIETLDSLELAVRLDAECLALNKVMPVLIEVNSGREQAKSGVFPEDVESLVNSLKDLENVRVEGLMTMGPFTGDPEDARPFFVETKKIFDTLKTKQIPGITMQYLSMGMSNSYRVAIEEGANIIRLGAIIFGPR